MHATLQLSSVEELPSAQQRIYVLSVTCVTIHDDDSSIATASIHDFQKMSKKLSFPIIIHHDDNGNGSSSIDNNSYPTIIINRLIEALQCGNHKLILRVWKKGARWWNLNMNHTQTSSSSSSPTTTLSMAKSEVAGYRLAKLAMDHHLEQTNNNSSGKMNNKINKRVGTHVPHVVYFSHDNGNTTNTTDDSWALFSYFDKIKGEINTAGGGGGNVNIINHSSSLTLDGLNRLTTQTTTAIQQPFSSSSSSLDHKHNNNYHNMKECCNHYPTTMTKSRHEFGFDEPHPRHGRVPIDECSEYAQMILRDVVLPIQFSFFEWSSSSSNSLTTPDGYINCNSVEWIHNLCTLGIDRQKVKPYHYHDMIAVYRDALERLSTAHHHATKVVDDERMDTLLQMMEKCVDALEHEWDDDENGRPPPLPAVLCHMDLQPQNLTFWHDRGIDENNANDRHIHVSQHCSVASLMDFEEAAYADPRFEVLLICRKVLANKFQAEELWKSYAIRVKMETSWDVGPIEPWLRLETVHSLLTLLLQANDLLGGGRNPWETKPDLIAKIDRERRRLVKMNWSFCIIKDD